MPAEQFNTLRTWYGYGYTTDGTKLIGSGVNTGNWNNWYAPYQQSALATTVYSNVAGQYYGNVSNFAQSTFASATPTAGSTSNYGLSSAA